MRAFPRHNGGVNVQASDSIALPPVTAAPRRTPALAWLALVVIIAVFVLRVAPGARIYSQTVDETYHVGAAVSLLEARTLVLGVQHPPLARYVMGLPLREATADIPEFDNATKSRKEDVAYAAGTSVLFSSQDPNVYWDKLASVRYAMLVFPVIAILYAFLLGRYLAGTAAGLCSALLLSLDTTLLGHGMWVTTDTAAAAGFLVVIYHGLRWVEVPTWGRAVVAGVAGGVGVSLKFSVALAAPGLVLAMGVVGLGRAWGLDVFAASGKPISPGDVHSTSLPVRVGRIRIDSVRSVVRRGAQLLVIGVVALVTIWATYKFHVGPMGDSDTLAAAPQWGQLPAAVLSTPVPMPSFWIGLGRLAANSASGSDSYLFGRLSSDGWWYYFPVVMVFKTPVGLLLAMIAGAVLAWEHKTRATPAGLLILAGLMIPAGVFLAASMASGVQIGIRHVLPFLVVTYVVAGVVLTRSGFRTVAVLMLCALAAVESGRRHPDYLSFFNVLAGSSRSNSHIAADSNLDWGQDLARLARRARSDEAFGRRLSAVYPLGGRQTPLFQALQLDPNLIDAPPRPGDLVAVSVTRRLLDPNRFEFLYGSTEVDRIGAGFLVYEFRLAESSSSIP